MIDEALVAGSDYRVLENDRPQYLPPGRLLVPLAWLRPNPENPREIDDEKAANLRLSIVERSEFMLKRPALVSDGPVNKLGGLIYGGSSGTMTFDAETTSTAPRTCRAPHCALAERLLRVAIDGGFGRLRVDLDRRQNATLAPRALHAVRGGSDAR